MRETYRHDFSALAYDAKSGTDVDDSTIHAPTRLFNHANNEENAGIAGDSLELLTSTVPTLDFCVLVGERVAIELPPHPRSTSPGTGIANRVAEVDSMSEVAKVLIPAFDGAGPDRTAEGGAAGITTDVGFREHKDVDLLAGGPAGNLLQLL